MDDLKQNPTDDREREEVRDELSRLMDTAWGRRLMWRLLSRTGMYRSSFTGESLTTSFNEGQRNIGLVYVAELTEFCPQQYARMFSENSET